MQTVALKVVSVGVSLCVFLQVSLLVECCCEARGIRAPLSRQALWSVTSKGDVMVHEPSPCLEAPIHTLTCDLM